MNSEALPIIFNIIMLAAILIPAVRGYLRGFIRTALHLLRFVLSFILSCVFAKPIGALLKEKWLYNSFHSSIRDALLGSAEELTNGEAMTNALPTGVRPILEVFGVDVQAEAQGAIATGEQMIESFSATIADKIAGIVGVAIAFIGVFLISLILLRIFSGILSAIVEKLPLIGKLNKLLGFVFGALIGVIVAWLVAQLLVTVLGAFTNVDYSGAVLLNFFHDISPVRWILQLLSQTMTGIV